MLPIELEKNEGGKRDTKKHWKLLNTTLKWSDKTKNELSFPAPRSIALVTTLFCPSTQQRTLHLGILLLVFSHRESLDAMQPERRFME